MFSMNVESNLRQMKSIRFYPVEEGRNVSKCPVQYSFSGTRNMTSASFNISGGPKKNAPTLVIFKNTRYVIYVIYVTYLSTVGKMNSLAFHPYPTFVILATSMDTILKTVPVVILK